MAESKLIVSPLRQPDPLTQCGRLLAFIRENPSCTTMEITLGLAPFVANPRARISDLRITYGIDVVCEKRPDGYEGFRVRERGPLTLGLTA